MSLIIKFDEVMVQKYKENVKHQTQYVSKTKKTHLIFGVCVF